MRFSPNARISGRARIYPGDLGTLQMLLHPLMMDFSFCILAEPKVGQVEAECPKEASVSPNSSALYLKSWSPPSAIFFNAQPILATLLTQIRALPPNIFSTYDF